VTSHTAPAAPAAQPAVLPRPLLLAGALLALLPAGAGCRYHLGGDLPRHIRTVRVRVLENRTRERRLESEVTAAVVEALEADGRLRVARSMKKADAELTGAVVSFRREIRGEDVYGDAVELRIIVEARVTLRDLVKEKTLLADESVSSQMTDLDSGLYDLRRAVPESAGRRRAISALGRNIARKVLDLW